jgi:hypothetical protein
MPSSIPALSHRPENVHRSSSDLHSDNKSQVDIEKPVTLDEQEGRVDDPYAPRGVEKPWKYKGPALACIIFLTRESGVLIIDAYKMSHLLALSSYQVGSNFADSSLSPLKSTIKLEVPGVNNARYGTIASADALINGILPILTGIVIDYYGPSGASLVASTCILLGCIVRAIGGSTGSFST